MTLFRLFLKIFLKNKFNDEISGLAENQHKRTIEEDRTHIEQLKPYIGKRELDMINMGCLQSFIEIRKEEGVKNRTIIQANYDAL